MKNTIITAIITFIITLAGCYLYVIRYAQCDKDLVIKNHQSYLDSRAKKMENKSDSLQAELDNCQMNYKAVADELLGEGNHQIK